MKEDIMNGSHHGLLFQIQRELPVNQYDKIDLLLLILKYYYASKRVFLIEISKLLHWHFIRYAMKNTNSHDLNRKIYFVVIDVF